MDLKTIFETGSHCIALTSLELRDLPACLCLPTARLKAFTITPSKFKVFK